MGVFSTGYLMPVYALYCKPTLTFKRKKKKGSKVNKSEVLKITNINLISGFVVLVSSYHIFCAMG